MADELRMAHNHRKNFLFSPTKQDSPFSIKYQCRDAVVLMPSGNHLQDVYAAV